MNKDVAEHCRLLESLGWSLDRQQGHAMVWKHPSFVETLKVPKTPSDWRWRRNAVGDVRRLQPDHFRVEKSTREKRSTRRHRQSTLAIAAPAAPRERLDVPEGGMQTFLLRCGECARPWTKSEAFRPDRACPFCGSAKVLDRRVAA